MIKNPTDSPVTGAEMGKTGHHVPPGSGFRDFLWDVFGATRFRGETSRHRALNCENWAHENMAGAAVDFVSVPWFWWIHAGDERLCGRIGELRSARGQIDRLDIGKLAAGVQGRDNVTILAAEFIPSGFIDVLKQFGVRRVFMDGGSDFERRKLRARGIMPLPFTFLTQRPPPPPRRKDVLFSFIGGASNQGSGIRSVIKQRFAGHPFVLVRPDNFWMTLRKFPESEILRSEAQYDEAMARSRFALCPGGWSPQSVRFYEALGAGAIPVVIAENWFGPAWNWEETCIFLTQGEFDSVAHSAKDFEKFLERYSAREDKMRENCRRAWQVFNRESLADYVCRVCAAGDAYVPAERSSGKLDNEAARDFHQFSESWGAPLAEVAPAEVIPLPTDRITLLFEILGRTKAVPVACTAAGIGRSQWDTLLATFPDFRRQVVAIVGADGVRARW